MKSCTWNRNATDASPSSRARSCDPALIGSFGRALLEGLMEDQTGGQFSAQLESSAEQICQASVRNQPASPCAASAASVLAYALFRAWLNSRTWPRATILPSPLLISTSHSCRVRPCWMGRAAMSSRPRLNGRRKFGLVADADGALAHLANCGGRAHGRRALDEARIHAAVHNAAALMMPLVDLDVPQHPRAASRVDNEPDHRRHRPGRLAAFRHVILPLRWSARAAGPSAQPDLSRTLGMAAAALLPSSDAGLDAIFRTAQARE